MISQTARNAFDSLFTQAVRSAFSVSADEQCEVTALTDAGEITEKKVVVLTVSSYVFRVMVFLYFTLDNRTKQHFAALQKGATIGMSEADHLDAICEWANVLCGSLNREIARHFPHVGMSTPNILDRSCVGYLDDLGADHTKHVEIRIDDAFAMHASICVCPFADIDFTVDTDSVEESTGELEMF